RRVGRIAHGPSDLRRRVVGTAGGRLDDRRRRAHLAKSLVGGISEMGTPGITLTRHIMTKKETAIPVRDLALIMERIDLVAKRIARELAAASLSDEVGYTGATNVQGEKVKKLDEWGNEVFVEAFTHGYPVCSLISEEMEQAHHYSENCRDDSYCILYDPIDGSSNTDVNGSLGTIFA